MMMIQVIKSILVIVGEVAQKKCQDSTVNTDDESDEKDMKEPVIFHAKAAGKSYFTSSN